MSAVPEGYRPPYRYALAAALALFALYAGTLAPTTAFWDTSEYITTAHILGIPHPPGNPLFVALGRVWILLLSPLPLTVAQRVNLLAAATSAASFGFFFLVAHRLLRPALGDRIRSLVGAGASVLVGATAYTVWAQSNVNEKVYTVSLLVIAAVSWLALLWVDRKDEPGSLRYLLAAGYLMVLGSTNHLMSLLPLPALGLLVLLEQPTALLRRKLWVRAVPLVLVGLSFSFFLPIRARHDPVINEGDPTCESAVEATVAVYTAGRSGCPALAASLTREQYAKPPLTERQAPLHSQLLNWVQYFDWQWARGADAEPSPGGGRTPFTVLFGALALLGLWTAFRAHPPGFVYLGTLSAVLTVALVYYLNFEYGYSLAPEIQDPGRHEVRERDYFFIAGFALLGVLAGVGLSALWSRLAGALELPRPGLMAAPVLLLALLPLASNWAWADRSGEYAARDWAFDLLASVEPYAILFTNGDNDTFPLWYLQEVEGFRRDVTVVVGQYLFTDWYPKQLVDLTSPCPEGVDPADAPTRVVCQRPFRPGQVGGLYEAPPRPGRPLLDLPSRRIDAVREGVLPADTAIGLGAFAIRYPEGSYLSRADRLVLRIVRDTAGERPVYFASSAGLMRGLGLDRWGVRHGLVSKLVLRTLDDDPPPELIRLSDRMGGEWIHLQRTRRLVDEVYRYRSLENRYVWPDFSTLNVPWQYYALFLQLSEAVAEEGGDGGEAARRYRNSAAGFLVTARGGVVAVPEPE